MASEVPAFPLGKAQWPPAEPHPRPSVPVALNRPYPSRQLEESTLRGLCVSPGTVSPTQATEG